MGWDLGHKTTLRKTNRDTNECPRAGSLKFCRNFGAVRKMHFFAPLVPVQQVQQRAKLSLYPTLQPVKDIFVSLLQMFDSVAEAVAAAGLDQD